MNPLTIFLNIFLLKLIISMKKAFNFLLIEKSKKEYVQIIMKWIIIKLFGNKWFKKPKIISNDELNKINYIIDNLKIKK